MSHVTRVTTVLTEKETAHIHTAAKCLGLEKRLKPDGHPSHQARTYGGHFTADLVFGIPGNSEAYDIGFKLNDSKWEVLIDNFAGGHGLTEFVGFNGHKFLQKVSDLRVAEAASQSMLEEVNRTVAADGTITIQLAPTLERQYLQTVKASY